MLLGVPILQQFRVFSFQRQLQKLEAVPGGMAKVMGAYLKKLMPVSCSTVCVQRTIVMQGR